jgi:beta-glucosidase
MAQATFHFPRGFLWGTATAAHQVEGGNTNNTWWAWEQDPAHILQGHQSGAAADWWGGGRWREDFDRAAEAHQNAHRLSIEWSRVQPAPDRWDEEALDRYRELVQGLQERGMLPLVTLHHFSDPLWFMEQGGWENEASPGYFEKYVRKVVEVLREYVTLWCTINEPNVYLVYGYVYNTFPPGGRGLKAALTAAANLVRAHAAAYRAIHSLQPQARVGIAHQYRGFHPARTWLPTDRLAAGVLFRVFNEMFPRALHSGVMPLPVGSVRIPEARATQDYLGVNYYTCDRVSFSLIRPKDNFIHRFFPEGCDLSDTGFNANLPLGMFEALNWGRQFQVPMIVTENGIEDAKDTVRPRYLIQHVHQVWRAVNFNWPVKGYFWWTLVDNFEWDRGWTQRFGLWELDPETQARKKRPSADLYAEICRENGLSSEMVEKYAPEVLPKLFPE